MWSPFGVGMGWQVGVYSDGKGANQMSDPSNPEDLGKAGGDDSADEAAKRPGSVRPRIAVVTCAVLELEIEHFADGFTFLSQLIHL